MHAQLNNKLNRNKLNRSNGFTLIEILIVVMLIGILSGVMLRVINVQGVRSKTRDSQRTSALAKIQTALELYYTDSRQYPNSGSPNCSSLSSDWNDVPTMGTCLQSYLNEIPSDPSPDRGFEYKYKSDGTTYSLTAVMEVSTSAEASPCGTNPYAGGPEGCYEVQNPL